jgi:H+/Cl- antiporter ClcA
LPIAGGGATSELLFRSENESPQQARREWWRLLAFAALGMIIAEWLVYHRATLARVWVTIGRKISSTRN